ncbi:hypothetical protein ACM41_06245 [Bradyrhizobium sp. CCBAU 21362]|uniref:hypothetical protein n=1 Tax=Bradyrhizobium sp. CCBAU 21362 TaxID=1325082 RepID=UPI0023062739|nr:hypothetical protein [Bradyrhizobium sp. CCBAU 21362]MDA9535877.1 hypothetical protein [Bradyrhizobium sp. CCBAU 21362]
MAPCPEQTVSSADDLEVAADQAIVACGGDAREAVKALLIALDFLEVEAAELRAAVSKGYSRGRHAALGQRKEIE